MSTSQIFSLDRLRKLESDQAWSIAMPLGFRHCQGTSAHGLDPNAPSMANAHLIMLWFHYDSLRFFGS